jgi:S-adenosylmethionine decarboxylase
LHLVIDGYGGNVERMQDMNFVFDLLDRYPAKIGMNKIAPPYVFRYSGVKPEDWGITGIVLIAESHISIHTFPDQEYMCVDIFSCKEFDAQRALDEISEWFGLREVKSYVLERGLEYCPSKQIVKTAG